MNLNLKSIADPVVRENFMSLLEAFQTNPFLGGDWKMFEQSISSAGSNIKMKHSLAFVPDAIIPIYIEGNQNFYFRTDLSDRNYVYGTAGGPCLVRYIAGRFGGTSLAGRAFSFIPSGGVVSTKSFTLADNTASQVITGMQFDSSDYLSFEITWVVYRESTGGGAVTRTERGTLIALFDGTNWTISEGQTLGEAGVDFDIDTATGQVEVTTDDQAGTYQASTSVLIWYVSDLVEAL